MKRYQITLYKQYSGVQLYTVHFDGEGQNETDAFISRFSQLQEYAKDYNTIIFWIDKIARTGALERYFRMEGKALAIPIVSGSSLRLYCYRVNDGILILGNGGIKASKKVKESPDCLPHFELMNHVAQAVLSAQKSGNLQVEGNKLSGQMKFNYK